ncbi:MAG: hypothetical protein AB2748_22945, partial [Candidatus Thiodiazotropha endolucinida]
YSQRLHDISNQVCETTRPGESVVYMKKLPLYLRNVNKYSIAKFAGENGTYECIDPEMRETITEALRRDKFGGNSKELAKALDTSHCSGSHGWGLGDIWEIIKDAGGKIKNTVECAGASAGLVLGCGFEVGGFVSCLHPKMRRQQPTV